MNKYFISTLFCLMVSAPPVYAEWAGTDETVIEKAAAAQGRVPSKPLFDQKGDLPLFLFLVAGAAGGFVAGYYFREVFKTPGDRKDV